MYSRVYIEITNICNMQCSFCHGHKREPKRMNQYEFSQILDQLNGHTQFIYYHLMGEPLTHPELPQFLQLANNKGFRSVITTNGTLLAKCGKDIIDAGVHKVSISIHSFEKDDDRSHERYINDVAAFADAATKSGILISLRLWNRGHDAGRNDKTITLLRSLLDEEWVNNTRGIRIRDKLFLEWGDRFEWPDIEAPVQSPSVFCYGLRDHFGILCDGSVVPCCLDSEGAVTLGNIFHENIDDILASPRAKAMVQGFSCRKATEELCRRCGYAQRF